MTLGQEIWFESDILCEVIIINDLVKKLTTSNEDNYKWFNTVDCNMAVSR